MAIKTKISAQALVLKLNLGEDKNGKLAYKNLTLKGIKPEALDQSIYEVAEVLQSVLPYNVETVSKSTETEILNDTI